MPRRGRSLASPLLSPPLLILLLPIIALAFLFFAVRPFISLTSHVLRPNTVKKSWDSLNIFLVLFAILCGFFARKNDDGLPPDETANNASSASNKTNEGEEEQSTSQQWFRYSETKIYDTPHVWAPATGVTRLKRSSSSYPDLRQESLWETGDDRFQFRFFDDFEIDKYRSLRPRNEPEEPEIKVIPVDTFTLRSSPSQPPPPKSPPPPPPPPNPPPAVQHKRKRTYRTVGRKDDDDAESTKTRSPPPPPPIPPPSPARVRSEQKYVKSERRKSNFKKEIAMAWDSLYNQRKRKKKQIKTKNVLDEPVQSPAEQVHHTRPPPPPPPPPSVFHSLFRKGSKSKKVHSVSTPPPPPPPPPPVKSSRSSERKIPAPPPPPVKSSRSSERKSPAPPPPPEPSRRRSSSFSNAGRPPLPTRANTWDENVNGIKERSPVIPMPPPPPPFKMPEMSFVKVRSAQSSRCGSPELEDADANKESLDATVNAMDGAGSVFCPSPDVNVKADTFIARLRDGWRLEKMNSLREKETMGLGPGP